MELDAFLADSVVNAEGKLYALGAGWSAVAVTALPARHPRIGIGMIFRVPYTETNKVHRPEIRLEDGDGHEMAIGDAPPGSETPDGKIYRVSTEFNVGRPAQLQPGDDQLVAMAVNIDGLVFERADSYRFVISIDGNDAKSLPLRVQFAG